MNAVTLLAPAQTGNTQWLRPLRNWPQMAAQLLRASGPLVRVLITHVRGSTPRDAGSCMLVSTQETQGTIGGGRLEWQAMAAARALLTDTTATSARLQRLTLGAELGQCCGGVVELWLERLTSADLPLLDKLAQSLSQHESTVLLTELNAGHVTRRLVGRSIAGDSAPPPLRLLKGGRGHVTLSEHIEPATPLWLYGAGHVGQALVRMLAELPLSVHWLDDRNELMPAELPDGVSAGPVGQPAGSIASAPAGTRFLVMTHDHALDYALCKAALQRADMAWVGLIGSRSKAARFRSRLRHDGIADDAIARLTCPVGITGIGSKWPAAIAVSVAAQILQTLPQGSHLHEPPAEPGCTPEACASCHQMHGVRP